MQHYLAYAQVFHEILSITFLLRTFFSPWKSIADAYPSNVLRYTEFAQAFTLNCTTRIIGVLFRTVALFVSVAAHFLLFIVFAAYLLLWICYPGTVIAAFWYVLTLAL